MEGKLQSILKQKGYFTALDHLIYIKHLLIQHLACLPWAFTMLQMKYAKNREYGTL